MATRPTWIGDKKVSLLVQYGAEKEAALPDVPFVMDLLKNDEDRALWNAAVGPLGIGRPYLLPPDAPKERVDADAQGFLGRDQRPGVSG